MKSNGYFYIFVLLLFTLTSDGMAQGIPRKTGLGVRGMLWTLKPGHESSVTPFSVSTSGVGGSLFFFSRINDNLFFEASLNSVVDAEIGPGVESTVLSPFLFGIRYDLMPTRLERAFQPYVGAGIGSYWLMHSKVGLGVSASMDARVGAYAGGGVNVVLARWLGLNSDMKYNFVDLKNTKVDKYTGLEVSFGFFFMWGKRREIFRVESVKVIVQDIYPAYYQFYNTYPIAMVTVRNTVRYPIEVNVRSRIQGYTERETESGFRRIASGETIDVPIHALFGRRLMEADQRVPAVIDLNLEVRGGAVHTQSLSAHVMVHHRNAWNGEIDKLAFFITPDDDRVLEASRSAEECIPDAPDQAVRTLEIARRLFDEFGERGFRYRADPNIPFYRDDRVQFATETMELMTGDCDDLVVLFSSLLQSAGISTAFVDVQDPEKDLAHVYLMFDTGLAAEEGFLVSPNEKRYVLRRNASGKRTVWIPLETTLIQGGFEPAWRAGARAYLEEGLLRHGIADGWVNVIDID